MKITFTEHALFEMARREISRMEIRRLLVHPKTAMMESGRRVVYQDVFHDSKEGKELLLRVVVERGGGGLRVITAYKTSKIKK